MGNIGLANGVPVPAEMPLAKAAGFVSILLQHFSDGEVARLKDRFPESSHNTMKAPPVVLAGQEREPARSANARRAVAVKEGHASAGQPVDIGSLNLRSPIPERYITHSHVVGVENDNIWEGVGSGGRECDPEQEEEKVPAVGWLGGNAH